MLMPWEFSNQKYGITRLKTHRQEKFQKKIPSFGIFVNLLSFVFETANENN